MILSLSSLFQPVYAPFYAVFATATASVSPSATTIKPPAYLVSGEFWATLLAFVLIATVGVEYLKKWGVIQSKGDKTLERVDLLLSVLWPDKTGLSESVLGRMIEQSEASHDKIEAIHELSIPDPGKRPPAWCCFEDKQDDASATLQTILSEVRSITRRLDSLEGRVESLEKRK